jgi:hypothetical protein
VELAERRMLAPARQAQYELRLVGATVLPQRQRIARSKYGNWLFVDHLEDATRTKRFKGKLPIPAEQLTRLTTLDEAGVWPDVVWLGHEVDERWQEGDPVPVPTPRHLREKDERWALRLKRGTELFVKGAGATLALAAAAPLAVGAVAIGALGTGMDPIIFGGVRHPKTPDVVMWAALAQWEWE